MKISLAHLRQSSLMGGTERYLNQLASFLCDRGHEVTIICRSRDKAPHPDARFVVLHDFALGAGWRRWAFARSVARHLRDNRYDVSVALGRTWGQDLVHIGGGCYQTHLDHNALELTADGLRQSATMLRLTDRVALAIERRTLAPGAYKQVLVNSNMVKADVVRRYQVAVTAIRVIPHGVDTGVFHPRHREGPGAILRQSLGYATDDLVFLFLASGFHRKGLDLLLEAFPEVARQHSRARLLVVGHDSSVKRYQTRAAQLGLTEQVRFVGRQSDVQYCYAAADVYVLPTRYDAFGLSVLEALATGMPVVTTDTCGAAELIEPGVQGSVIPLMQGVAALADALIAWCDHGRIRRTSASARAIAEKHDWSHVMQLTEALLVEVAGLSAGGAGHSH